MALTILIVDDSSAMQTVIRRMLSISGLEVGACYFARNGVEALAALGRNLVDLVISDINMQGLDGEGLLLRMMEDERLKGIPALIVSSDSTHERAARMLALGARGYLVKPFTPEALYEEVTRILELSHA
jgi:CheY-like chemotaxis protein